MDWFSGNSFFLIILLLCVGMHLFHGHGHGHGHGHRHRGDDDPAADEKGDGNESNRPRGQD